MHPLEVIPWLGFSPQLQVHPTPLSRLDLSLLVFSNSEQPERLLPDAEGHYSKPPQFVTHVLKSYHRNHFKTPYGASLSSSPSTSLFAQYVFLARMIYVYKSSRHFLTGSISIGRMREEICQRRPALGTQGSGVVHS
jgi:hypothetical protein